MTSAQDHRGADVNYQEVQARADFRELRRTHRSFAFPMTVFFLLWYLTYVVLGSFFPQLFTIKVIGNVNLGVLYGLSNFVVVFGITAIYVWYTNARMDPKSKAIREELEAAGVGLPEEVKA